MSSKSLIEWFEWRIEPANRIVEGWSKVKDIAHAQATLERGSGQLFGMEMNPDRIAQLRPLLPKLTAALAEWREVFDEQSREQEFAEICAAEGIAVPELPLQTPRERVPAEVEAFRAAPGDRQQARMLARWLGRQGMPEVAAHVKAALAFELHSFDEARDEAQTAFEAAHREALVRLLWPPELREHALQRAWFVRGLPVGLSLDPELMGRYRPVVWREAPLATVRLHVHGYASLARHPALARATALSLETNWEDDVRPLLAREGAPLEHVSLDWLGKESAQMLLAIPVKDHLRSLRFTCDRHLHVLDEKNVDLRTVEMLVEQFPALEVLQLERGLRMKPTTAAVLEAAGGRVEGEITERPPARMARLRRFSR